MAASFPTSIKSFTTKVDGVDNVNAEHVNSVQDEIVAIETALKTWTTYVPTWGNTGTANTTTDATITGRYMDLGDAILARIYLTWGAATASGNGAWTFTLPVPAAGLLVTTAEAIGSGLARDVSAGVYGVSVGLTSTTVCVPFPTNVVSNGIGATVPFTWVATDHLSLMIMYDKG